MTHPSPPVILAIAGHDPSGGAGIQADIETIGALGGHAATAITCLTVQNTTNVASLIPVAADLVERQARTVLADYQVKAIKIGLIGGAGIATAIGRILADHTHIPVIFDPVLAAGGGTELAGRQLLEVMRQEILPHTDLTTPNSVEARRLSGEATLDASARTLLAMGARAVLITGAHEESEEVINQLFRPGLGNYSLSWPRLGGSFHGSGCTLASAIATLIGQGLALEQAIEQAQAFTWNALNQAYYPGKGQAIPNRLQQKD